jgi:hypothetical protein
MPVFFLRPWFGLPTGSGYLGAPDQPLVTYSDRRTLSLSWRRAWQGYELSGNFQIGVIDWRRFLERADARGREEALNAHWVRAGVGC